MGEIKPAESAPTSGRDPGKPIRMSSTGSWQATAVGGARLQLNDSGDRGAELVIAFDQHEASWWSLELTLRQMHLN
jgi:hypothetical protein